VNVNVPVEDTAGLTLVLVFNNVDDCPPGKAVTTIPYVGRAGALVDALLIVTTTVVPALAAVIVGATGRLYEL
jgi:hypothetical protein